MRLEPFVGRRIDQDRRRLPMTAQGLGQFVGMFDRRLQRKIDGRHRAVTVNSPTRIGFDHAKSDHNSERPGAAWKVMEDP